MNDRALIYVGILYLLFGGSGGNDFCINKDNVKMDVGTQWKNEQNCSCVCVSVDNYTFVQCLTCSPTKKLEKIATCISNGLTYSGNDKWLSHDKECTLCKCRKINTVICDSANHCQNPCDTGQIPQFGPCCQVLGCIGKSTFVSRTISCRIDDIVVEHGKSIVRRFTCRDRHCTCINGNFLCFEYCELSKNGSHQFWNKLCCPRRKGTKVCILLNGMPIHPGETHLSSDGYTKCQCLDGELYCSKDLVSSVNINPIEPITQSSFITERPLNSTVNSRSHHTSHTSLVQPDTMKRLLVIMCIVFVVISLLSLVTFIIRMKYIHVHKSIPKNALLVKLIQEDIL